MQEDCKITKKPPKQNHDLSHIYLIPLVQQGGHCGGNTQEDLQHFGQVAVDEVT